MPVKPSSLGINFFLKSALLLLLHPFSGMSQGHQPPMLIKRLLATEKEVSHITVDNLSALPVPAGPYQENERYLIKTADGLFVGLDGTGILYKVSLRTDSLVWERVDRTRYAGAHFCAAHFSVGGRIYSFGGYGFWKTSGTLRLYNFENQEWDIQPLSDEHPNIFCPGAAGMVWSFTSDSTPPPSMENARWAPAFFWVDTAKHKFYSLLQRGLDDGVVENGKKKNRFTAEILELDLAVGRWRSIGKLKRYGWTNLVSVPWGLLINESSTNIYLADIIQNKISTLKTQMQAKYKKLYAGHRIDLLYCIDSTIFFGNIHSNTLDSIQLSQNDFTPTETYFQITHTPSTSIFQNSWIVLLLIAGGMLTLLYYQKYYRKRKQEPVQKISKTDIERPSVNMKSIFSEVEKSLLLTMLSREADQTIVSTDEVNRILGVASKSEAIKRKVRSEIIGSINDKWMLINGTTDTLIVSNRSENDRRNREYSIRSKYDNADRLKEFID